MRVIKSCLSKSYLKTKTAQVPCGNGTNSSFERNHSQIISLKAFSKRTALAWLRINILCSCACEHVCAPALFKKNSETRAYGFWFFATRTVFATSCQLADSTYQQLSSHQTLMKFISQCSSRRYTGCSVKILL